MRDCRGIIQKNRGLLSDTDYDSRRDKKYEAKDIEGSVLKILEDCKKRQLKIQDMQISRGSLEQHFMELMKGEEK